MSDETQPTIIETFVGTTFRILSISSGEQTIARAPFWVAKIDNFVHLRSFTKVVRRLGLLLPSTASHRER